MSNLPRLRLKVTKQRYSQLKKAMLNESPSHNPDQTNLTESDLRESEAFYRQMFEHNRAVQLVIDPLTTQIIQANQAACDFYGYTPEQMKSLHIADINTISEVEIPAIIQRVSSESGTTIQTQHRLASGVIRDVEVFAGVLELKGKRYFHNIIHDITERKQAEKALHESEELYHTLAQHMPNTGVLMFDMDMRYTLAEGEFLARFNLNVENVLGKTPQETLSEVSSNFILPIYKRALAGESFSFERVTEDYAYQAYITPLRDATGRIIGGMTMNHDITEIKQAEQALRKSEALYRLLARHMPNTSVVMFDTDLRYTLAEGPYLKRFGSVWDNAVGKHPKDMYTEEPLNYLLPLYRRALQGETFTFERITENYAYESFAAPVRDDGGHIIGGIILSHDITERKRAEKALRQNEGLLRLVIEHIPNTGVFMFDNDMRYTLSERPYLKNMGSSHESMVGKTLQEALPQEAVNFFEPIYRRVLDGEAFAYERVNGIYTFESYAAPVRDDSDQIIGGIILSHDISERKQAEKALRESEELHRVIIRNMPNTSVFMFDHDLRFTLVEGPYIKSSGADFGNMVGKTLQEMLPADSVNFLTPIYKRALQGESFTFEHITGTYAYEAYAAPVCEDSGKIIGGMIMSHDITLRKQAEKAQRESEALYHLFIQHMPNTSVIMFDTNKHFTLVEGGFLESLGLDSKNMIGKIPEEVFSDETLQFMLPKYERVLRGEAFAYDRTTPNYAYQAYASPLHNADGQIIGGMFLSHDVTEAKRNEAALRASEERYHSLVDLAPVGIIETDINGKRVFCNSRWCEMTGLTLEEALSDMDYATIYTDDLSVATSAWDEMMETNLPFDNVIFRYQRPDKSTVWVSGNGRPLYDLEGKITGYIGSVVDITESRSNQEKLRQERDLLRILIDHMPDYIFLKDVQGRFVLTNEAHAQAGGITSSPDMIGKTAFDLFPSEMARQFYSDDEAIMQSGEALVNAERKTVDAYGHQKTVLTTKIPWKDAKGQVLGLIGISRDITERKQLEDALTTSELRFRTLIDFAPVGIVETDAHGTIILGNVQWSALSGISLETPIVDNASQTIHPDDLEMIKAINQKMVETTGHVNNLEYRFVHPDGRLVWVSDNSRPLFDTNGVLTGYIVTLTDITERKLLEDALITSESRFRTLIDFAPVGIAETDAQGMLILGNPYWYTLSGISPDRAYVASGSETLHPDDVVRLQAVNQYMLENGSYVDNLEYRFLHPDGKVVWVSDSSRPLITPDGTVTGYIMSMSDITERKRLEDALRQNEERLQNITDNLEDLVSQSDAEGHFIFASPSYRSLLGYEPKSLMGTSSLEMIHPDDLESVNKAFQTAFETSSQQFAVECRLRHADGHYISVEIVGKLFFDSKSNFMGGIFVSRDISERKRMQNLVIDKEKLQTALDKELELNNLKTRMMTRIAHEFRTPLTVIQAATETLTHYLDRLTPAQRDSKDVMIKNQIQRLTDMLNEIGLVVRTDFTPDRVHRTQTDLSVLCRQIASKLERDLNQSGRFVLDLPEKTVAAVDPQVLHNAFMHVMRNAVRFSEATLPVNVRLSQTDKSITLNVTDNGIGIPPNEQARIFEPFFRGSNINELSGLGVGLTTARAAVEAHGGTISVDSVLGQGTTVTIWIPV